jgi:hypothetical protein
MEDTFTSTVDGAAGFERMRVIEEERKNRPSRLDVMDFRDEEEVEYDDYDRCNCSDPGCPCGGIKRGGV